MNSRGFTIVEILVVIIIMAILLTLAVVNVRSTQIQGRDSERKSDVENISKALESFQQATHASYDNTYPATGDITSGSYAMNFLLERTDAKSFQAPGITTAPPGSLVVATNNVQTGAGVTPTLTSKDTYIYQPLTKDGALCTAINTTTTCRKFNIYYKLEAATPDCPDTICMIRSTVQ